MIMIELYVREIPFDSEIENWKSQLSMLCIFFY